MLDGRHFHHLWRRPLGVMSNLCHVAYCTWDMGMITEPITPESRSITMTRS